MVRPDSRLSRLLRDSQLRTMGLSIVVSPVKQKGNRRAIVYIGDQARTSVRIPGGWRDDVEPEGRRCRCGKEQKNC